MDGFAIMFGLATLGYFIDHGLTKIADAIAPTAEAGGE